MRSLLPTVVALLAAQCAPGAGPQVVLVDDRSEGVLTVSIDGREAFAYRYHAEYAIPHIWPLRSPSGRILTVQHPDPYPHHRSVWIADKVQLGDGPIVDFYHCWNNYRDPDDPAKGYRSSIRHDGFDTLRPAPGAAKTEQTAAAEDAVITASLSWVIEETSVALREKRTMRIEPLGGGEYLIDLSWTLTSAGDVTFHSDWVHYAWPYVRMDPPFSGDSGGSIIDDQGRTGQSDTNEKYAKWMDYSNTVDGVTEGVAMFIYPDGEAHKWLTREYGTWGPRRVDRLSGTGFTLRKGESVSGRVGILVHKGDSESGRVAERYEDYIRRAPGGR